MEDPNEIKLVDEIERETSAKTKKTINKGRNTLFIVGGFYVLVGIYEAFFAAYSLLLFGIIDWFIAAVFIGLAFLSYKKASTAMITGLIFYLFIILLLAILDPSSIISGILWKILITMYLSKAIKQAREDESKTKVNSGDLLDQF